MALDFDPNEYSSADNLEPVPAGRYKVKVQRINSKPAFANFDDRKNYDVGLEIIEGEYSGRLLWEYLTLYAGKSEKQNAYSRSRLKLLMWSCYLPQLVKGVEDLKDRECEVEAWIDEGLDSKTREKKFPRRNKFKYVIPDDFERPGTKPAADTPSASSPAKDSLPDDDIPFA